MSILSGAAATGIDEAAWISRLYDMVSIGGEDAMDSAIDVIYEYVEPLLNGGFTHEVDMLLSRLKPEKLGAECIVAFLICTLDSRFSLQQRSFFVRKSIPTLLLEPEGLERVLDGLHSGVEFVFLMEEKSIHEFLQSAMLVLARNDPKNSEAKDLGVLWGALTSDEKVKANSWIDVLRRGGTFSVYSSRTDKSPVLVDLPSWPKDGGLHDWRLLFMVNVFCKVCRSFGAFLEDLPVECPNCDRTLRAECVEPMSAVCGCYVCDPPTSSLGRDRMYVCVTCGNKRCPHANDHTLSCTGSNEPSQTGSEK